MGDILVVADTQVSNETPTEHLKALSRYICQHKPDKIVHIGDHWDFPSLSSHAPVLKKEGRRLVNDLKGGFKALDLIMYNTLAKYNFATKRKLEPYYPEKYFIMGNHENRLNRFLEENPVLCGLIDIKSIIESMGWMVYDFLKPLWLDEICFIHYLPNTESSKAVGGSIENKLNKFSHSFVHGHQQKYQYGRRQNMQGKPHFGVCAGSFYLHDEAYRGANNTEQRGFVHMRSYENRFGYLDHDVEFVSIERLLEQY